MKEGNINRVLTTDEKSELGSFVIDEIDHRGMEINKLTQKMTTWRYRTFTSKEQKRKDGGKLKSLIEDQDLLRLAGKPYIKYLFQEKVYFETRKHGEEIWIQ